VAYFACNPVIELLSRFRHEWQKRPMKDMEDNPEFYIPAAAADGPVLTTVQDMGLVSLS
jgi:hypothetical protein